MSARKSVDAYREAFLVLVAADREVTAKTAIYKNATHLLEVAADQLARAGLTASQESLETASTTTWVSILVVLLLSLGAVGAGVNYGSRISLHITRPVARLTALAERVSMGDLSLVVEHTCDDEIGDLEDSLARLVTAVRFFQAESRQVLVGPVHGEKQ